MGIFLQYKILILLKCAVDSKQNGVINSVAACSVAELYSFIEIPKIPAFNFNGLTPYKNLSTTVDVC